MNPLFGALFIALVAVAVWFLSARLDTALNACALGRSTPDGCVCPAPFSGVHCELIDCSCSREVTSVWEVDLITTPSEEVPCTVVRAKSVGV